MLQRIWHGRLMGLRLIIILAVAALVMIGLVTIYSASGSTAFAKKQLVWIAMGLIAFVAVNMVHYRTLGQISYLLFVVSLVLLAAILVGKYLHLNSIVPGIRGSYRWISIPPATESIPTLFRFQPSELAKLAYILALAWYLQNRENFRSFKGLAGPFLLTMLPMALIILEPDLGTVLLFLPILFSLLFVAGARIKHLLAIIFLGVLCSPLFYLVMEDYQLDRIRVLLRQNTTDTTWLRGNGYQLHQSKICIGSGGLTGQGTGQSPFVKYSPPPDKHNDFIFALIGHQWGLLGSIAVLALYTIIIITGIEIAANQTDPFGRLLAIGICALMAAQTFINIGMTIGIMPITGMTLPFVSYGGSSMLCNFIALGLLTNVARHRPRSLAKKPFEFDDE